MCRNPSSQQEVPSSKYRCNSVEKHESTAVKNTQKTNRNTEVLDFRFSNKEETLGAKQHSRDDSKSFSFELQVNGKEASVRSIVLMSGYTIPLEELTTVIAELIHFKLFSKHCVSTHRQRLLLVLIEETSHNNL